MPVLSRWNNDLKVIVSREGVASFNRAWPCSTLRDSRAYWFEFDSDGDLIDTDCPEQDDGPAATAMADDCRAWLFHGSRVDWAPGEYYDEPVGLACEREAVA